MILLNFRTFRCLLLTSIFWLIFLIFTTYFYFKYLTVEYQDIEILKLQIAVNSNSDDYQQLHNSSRLKRWYPVLKQHPHYRHHGENGSGVTIPEDQMDQVNKTFTIHQFNLVASDFIPFNRTIKDLRTEECKSKIYPEYLPTTSVIIIFHNEAWSTLLRTIWSVIIRSPKELIEEIILVDDASELEHLGSTLENHLITLPVKIQLFRTVTRLGLVGSRLLGAKNARGAVLTFLDSHCECTDGWLEPLLSRVAENRKAVICPIIDTISDEDFSYHHAVMNKGGFNWRLLFRWLPLSINERDELKNGLTMKTAAMAGGLFAIDREYFYEIGSYDESMQIWGSENIEMSLRIWQCGGSLDISLCSRVGHVFRKKSPHTFPDGVRQTVVHNALRIVEVWLDEWKYFYYALNPADRVNVTYGDVNPRIKLRKDLKCKSFRWYLENIFPESAMLYNATYLGQIRNVATKECLDANVNKNKLGNRRCNNHYYQGFMLTTDGRIVSLDKCLDCNKTNGFVYLYKCHGLKGNQEFFYNNTDHTIMHVGTRQCIQNFDKNNPTFPILKKCDFRNPNQKWILRNDYKWKQYMENFRAERKS